MRRRGEAEPASAAAEAALRALGLRCTVEGRETLAVLIPEGGERGLEDASVRRAALAALRAHGFTHAAVEPPDERDRAPTASAPTA